MRARRFGIAAFAAATWACGLVIGLDERGARPDAASPAVDASNDLSTSDQVVADAGPRWCTTAGDGALFCDDFDEPGQAPSSRWLGFPTLLPSPLVNGEASLVIEQFPAARSKPAVLFADFVRGAEKSTAAILFHGVDQPLPVGTSLVLSFDVQVVEFKDLNDAPFEPSDVGPFPEILDESKIAVASIVGFTKSGSRYGSVLTISQKHIAVAEGYDTSDKLYNYDKVADVNLQFFGTESWVRMHLASGPRDKIIPYVTSIRGAVGTPHCPDDAGSNWVTVGWASVPPEESGCIPSSEADNPLAQGTTVGWALGTWATNPARARIRFDNARVDVIRP